MEECPVHKIVRINYVIFMLLSTSSLLYGCGEGINTNPTKNENETIKKLMSAAEKGDVDSQNTLGSYYYKGKYVQKDIDKSILWYTKAAEQGYALAQFNLGALYLEGGTNETPIDLHMAIEWLTKAADQNLAEAQWALAACYYDGIGVNKDRTTATNWYRKAAEQNHAEAQSMMGVIYALGECVPADYVQAYMWGYLANSKGSQSAGILLDRIAPTMNRSEIQKAEKLAKEFISNHLPQKKTNYIE